jgi:4'-phosphopantetheinyl transferase EntD
VPPEVALAGGPVWPDYAFVDAEARIVTRASAERRAEFAAGRTYARSALRTLDVTEPVAILKGPAGEPLWPTGIVGSITHCPGFALAAVARTDEVETIGVDVEPNEPLPEEIRSIVLLPGEPLVAGNPLSKAHLDRLTFSAKEAAYKAWFQVHHEWIDFQEVLTIVTGSCFVVSAVAPRLKDHRPLLGRWAVSDGRILTAVVRAKNRSP